MEISLRKLRRSDLDSYQYWKQPSRKYHSFWEKGIVKQALRLWVNQLCALKSELVRLGLSTLSRNTGMIKLAEKIGMEKEATSRKARLMILSALVFLSSCNQRTSNHLIYIDQKKPALQPLLFAENFISKETSSEFGSVFSKGGDEFYFAIDSGGVAKILSTKGSSKGWTEPSVIVGHEKYSYNDPFLSPDENRLYYISDMPINDKDTTVDYDIWYSEKLGTAWSAPINAGSNINTEANEYYISFTAEGAMYFASNKKNSPKRKHDYDIYKAEFVDGNFIEPSFLCDSINTKWYEADVFISPDESYIIFCSARKTDGYGRGDLYISFRGVNDKWTQAKNMGPMINSDSHELCPFVTRDGKYLFYTSNQDIYWVSTEIIANLKASHVEE